MPAAGHAETEAFTNDGAPRPAADASELYRAHWTLVVSFVARKLGNWEEAEVIAQEALLKTMARAEEEPIAHFGAYALRVAANLVIDLQRRKEWRAGRVDPDGLESPQEPPEADLVALREAVTSLRPDQRQIVALRYDEERSFADIAEVLSMSKNGVFVRHERALEALRRILLRGHRG